MFSLPDPIIGIKPFRDEAFGYVHRWTGIAYYRHDQSLKALYHLLRAVRHQPSYLSDKEIKQVVLSIFSRYVYFPKL